jgi:hypothetical protein
MTLPTSGAGASPSRTTQEPDAHGQAALLLAESTLHTLVEKTLLTVEEAVSVVQTAAEAKVAVAIELGESKGRMEESLELLARISDTFAIDAAPRARHQP